MNIDPNAPYRRLQLTDAGVPDGVIPSTLCGTTLIHFENVAIGGIIYIGDTYYAVTSGKAVKDGKRAYKMQASSLENLDWGLCAMWPEDVYPNMHDTRPLLEYMTAGRVGDLAGQIQVLVGPGPGTRGNFDPSNDEIVDGVKTHALLLPIEDHVKIPTAAWVVKDDLLCGYIVRTAYRPGGGRFCYMIPIWQMFDEIERIIRDKIVFGWQLHEEMGRRRVWGGGALS